MNASHSLLHLSHTQAAAELMSAVARRDESVSLLCEPGGSTAALLDEAENELSKRRLRCVRVYGPSSGGLALRDLVAQIVDRADPDALTDHDLKAGFVRLTEPGEGYHRVALLVTEAHNLTPAALHYIQFACRSGPKLRVALAGQRGLSAALARDEFADLRQRITRTLKLPSPARGKGLSLPSWVLRRWSVPDGLRRVGARTLIRLGAVATSVLLIAAVGLRHGPSPSGATLEAADASLGSQAALAHASPGTAAAHPQGPAEPTAAQQDVAAAVGHDAEEAALPEPSAVDAPTLEKADAPIGLGFAPPFRPAEDEAARDAPPVPVAFERAPEPAPEAAPPARVSAVASVSVLPPRALAAAVLPPDPSLAWRPRGGAEHAVASTAALPTRPMEGRRCRDIVLHAQSGKDLSDADHSFLRHDCRAK